MARSRAAAALLVAAIVAVALNQRPAVVAVAPVLGDLRAETGMPAALAGLLTTLPVLCMGLFAPVSQVLARRVGREATVGWALVLLFLGQVAHDVAKLVVPAPLDGLIRSEDRIDGRPQGLRPVDDEQVPSLGIEAASDQVLQ